MAIRLQVIPLYVLQRRNRDLMSALHLRPTVLSPDHPPASDDWTVIFDGEPVGRIVKELAVRGDRRWSWSITLGLLLDPSSGWEQDFEAAKKSWQRAWLRLIAKYGLEKVEYQLSRNRETAELERRWKEGHGAQWGVKDTPFHES